MSFSFVLQSTNCFLKFENAAHCKGSWRLVFRQGSVPEDRLSLPVQPYLPQPHLRIERPPRMRGLVYYHIYVIVYD